MNDLVGFEEASAALDTLLFEVRTTLADLEGQAAADATHTRNTLADRLVEFVKRSKPSRPSEMAAIDDLDALANETRHAVMAQEIGVAVATLQENTARLASLAKRINSETKHNEAAARALRLEPIRDIVSSVEGLLGELKAANDEIKSDPGLATVAKRAESLQTAFTRLKQAVEAA